MKITAMVFAALLSITACTAQTNKPQGKMDNKKTLVAYFSRADENYSVGYIEKGNTQIIAEFIAQKTGAETFRIETATPYPTDYNECIEVAKKEKNAKARPAIKGDVNIEDYDVVFIGMPNWWAEMPMAIYTFVEKHDWQGKTIVPFCTHEGSGMGGMDKNLLKACKGATMLKGFDMYGHEAQNEQQKAKAKVEKWIDSLDL